LNADASSDLQFLLTYEGKAGKGPFPSSSTWTAATHAWHATVRAGTQLSLPVPKPARFECGTWQELLRHGSIHFFARFLPRLAHSIVRPLPSPHCFLPHACMYMFRSNLVWIIHWHNIVDLARSWSDLDDQLLEPFLVCQCALHSFVL
jgi:hypothetical protein